MYTVKQLALLAQVSVRTLHYYDEIDLLKPAHVGANGYRYYDDAALYRLQQILFYREMDLELLHIKALLDNPDFDLVTALRAHRKVMSEKIKRLHTLIETVDSTIMHLVGEVNMSKKHRLFGGFSEEQQQDYERAARLQYGAEIVNDSIKRWNDYSPPQRQAILDEGNQIYADLADALQAGKAGDSDDVQAMLRRWHQHIGYFYEPTLDILRGLGDLYVNDPDFAANFSKLHPDLSAYMRDAIVVYVDQLETAAIERLLAEDDSSAAHD